MIIGVKLRVRSILPSMMEFDLSVKNQAPRLTQKNFYPMLMTVSDETIRGSVRTFRRGGFIFRDCGGKWILTKEEMRLDE